MSDLMNIGVDFPGEDEWLDLLDENERLRARLRCAGLEMDG